MVDYNSIWLDEDGTGVISFPRCDMDSVEYIPAIPVRSELASLRAENERLWEALEPSGDTKAAYMGEIRDPDTKRYVSWSAIKMIMKIISDRAAKEALK